ncbi:MAG: APC family permease [Candidatus Eremiobacteraeota bacterium]|nr:APC family permease [Candidatus Eremiobacteraeota bacterium]
MLRFFDISVLSSASMGPAYSLASTMGPMVVAAGFFAPTALLVLVGIMLCIAVGFSRLSLHAPNAGSSYSWIEMAFGRGVGAYGAWLLLLSNFFATMACSIPAGIYTLDLLNPSRAQNPLWDAAVGGVWILGSGALLYAGVRPTALVTAGLLSFELLVLAASAIAASLHPSISVAHPASIASAPIALTAFGFINAMTLGIWMSDGWEVSASTSEEVSGKQSQSGRGGITGLLVTSVILFGCMVAYLHLGGAGGFSEHADDSMAYVATLLGGRLWRVIIILTVLISTCTALWTTLLYLSRSVFAMGRNGTLPHLFGTLDRRAEPFWSLFGIAILVTACELLVGLSPTANRALTFVLNASSVFLGLLFCGSAAASMRLFWNQRRERLAGVITPGVGLVALCVVLAATIRFEDPQLRMYALIGIALGVPFALLVRVVGQQAGPLGIRNQPPLAP